MGFAEVASLVELTPTSTLIIDVLNQRLILLDWTAGLARQVGRTGEGPEEYWVPHLLLPFRDERALMVDRSGRLFECCPAGRLRALGRAPGTLLGNAGVRYADAAGRIYIEVERTIPNARAGESPPPPGADSLTIVRWDPSAPRLDSMAKVARDPGSVALRRGDAVVSLPNIRPLATRDQWAVSVAGDLAIIHPYPYHLRVLGQAGHWLVGPVLSYASDTVTDAIRREWADRTRRFPVTVGDVKWPGRLPPFLNGALRFDLQRRVWVQRTRHPESAQRYDVLDTSGALVARVRLEAGDRIIGFGVEELYVARFGTDDDSRIARFPLSRLFSKE